MSQRSRFIAFLVNVGLFYAAWVWATGSWAVGRGPESGWLVAAMGWWLLGSITAPWFRPPRDALAGGVSAFVLLASMDVAAATSQVGGLEVGWWIAMTYAVGVIVLAFLGGVNRLTPNSNARGRAVVRLAGALARGEALFLGPALVSIHGWYSSGEVRFALTALWVGFALVRPVELIQSLIGGVRRDRTGEVVGSLQRVDHPNIVRVALTNSTTWTTGQWHIAHLPGEGHRYVYPLYTQTHGDGVLGTGLSVADVDDDGVRVGVGSVMPITADETPGAVEAFLADQDGGMSLVGFVVEGSTIGSVRFEHALGDDLVEGSVVVCVVGAQRVFYQVLDAKTSEESFERNPRGTHIVTALQLGFLNPEDRFEKFRWLPPMNCPVYVAGVGLASRSEPTASEFVVGELPMTGIQVKADLDDLIGYHTAVLGVTGTGKTELALDIVSEALDRGTKVLCVDLTGEYRVRLADRAPVEIGLRDGRADELDARLFDVETGTYGATAEKKALKEFLDGIRGEIRADVDDFLHDDDQNLALLELAEVTNTRATLRTTELILTEVMLWARAHRKQRRILIVLEEAHTIIPETTGSGFDFDTQWVVSRIGQIALQGRKYGVGLLVVSQRTALVSKTILSQCNTYFAHALVDRTSLDYLRNVLGSDHVNSIPNLGFLEFIAVGKAIGSERPVLLHRPFDEAKLEASRGLDLGGEPLATSEEE